jgi:uncharacterized protein YwlG (UPF0340 family)
MNSPYSKRRKVPGVVVRFRSCYDRALIARREFAHVAGVVLGKSHPKLSAEGAMPFQAFKAI